MKNKILRLVLSLIALPILLVQLFLLCSLSPVVQAGSQTTTVIYTPTTKLFPNPERGFYHHLETHSNSYIPLDLNTLRNYRQNENITLILRLFYLDDFVNSNISHAYLAKMQADFETVRTAGLKAIVRFAYTNQPHFTPGTTWPPIPPYGDATKQQILAHLRQLQPVLRANRDVITVVQAGFIGLWGEWYYTDHFVQDPSNPGVVTALDWARRREVLSTTLAMLPTGRMVQVRTPLIKQMILSRTSPLAPSEAYKGSDVARTGHHNDCFLASETDFGAYVPPVEIDKAYLETETLYLPMGGETCNDTTDDNPPSDRSRCPTALAELKRFHWSYLNIDYHPDVIANWRTVCLDEIKRLLGYRLVLTEATYTNEVKAGERLTVELKLQNDGWAAPFNPRLVKLLLRHTTGGLIYAVTLPDDPRLWLADNTTHSLTHTICTPITMPPGNYELLLYLPDPEPSLYWRPEYAIRFANDMIWEDSTGYNRLLHTIKVSEPITNSACSVPPILELISKAYLPIILGKS